MIIKTMSCRLCCACYIPYLLPNTVDALFTAPLQFKLHLNMSATPTYEFFWHLLIRALFMGLLKLMFCCSKCAISQAQWKQGTEKMSKVLTKETSARQKRHMLTKVILAL